MRAKKLETQDEALLNGCLLADFNLLCADAAITAGDVRSYLGVKYGTAPIRLVLSQALAAPELEKRREEMGISFDRSGIETFNF